MHDSWISADDNIRCWNWISTLNNFIQVYHSLQNQSSNFLWIRTHKNKCCWIEGATRMLFLHFLYSKTFKCIFVYLCSKVLTLCTLRLSSFFAFKYLRIYFQTPCWTRLMLHVRKYRMKHNLKNECYAPFEHWHCIENPNYYVEDTFRLHREVYFTFRYKQHISQSHAHSC